MNSPDGEKVLFPHPVQCENYGAEKWLRSLEMKMVETLKRRI